jgi:hypothetical protein
MEKQQTTKTNWLRDPHRRKPTYLTSLQSHTAHSSLSNRPTTEAVNSYGTQFVIDTALQVNNIRPQHKKAAGLL